MGIGNYPTVMNRRWDLELNLLNIFPILLILAPVYLYFQLGPPIFGSSGSPKRKIRLLLSLFLLFGLMLSRMFFNFNLVDFR